MLLSLCHIVVCTPEGVVYSTISLLLYPKRIRLSSSATYCSVCVFGSKCKCCSIYKHPCIILLCVSVYAEYLYQRQVHLKANFIKLLAKGTSKFCWSNINKAFLRHFSIQNKLLTLTTSFTIRNLMYWTLLLLNFRI